MDRKPLNTWVHPQDRVTLLGDACHPMLVKASWHVPCSTKYAPLFSHIVRLLRRRDRCRIRSRPLVLYSILARLVAFASSRTGTPMSILRPSGSYLLLFPPAPPSPSRGKGPSRYTFPSASTISLTKANSCAKKKRLPPCDGNVRIIPSEPKDLPSTGRSRTTRTR